MAEIRFSETAEADLESIRTAGIERFGERAAERHLLTIRQGLEQLSRFSFAGQERPEFRQAIRSVSRRLHRILYSAEGDIVLIIRVIHQARDVAEALSGLH